MEGHIEDKKTPDQNFASSLPKFRNLLQKQESLAAALTVELQDTFAGRSEIRLPCQPLLESVEEKLYQLRDWMESWEAKATCDHLTQMRCIRH